MEYSKLYLDAVKFAVWRHALNMYDDEPYYIHFEDLEQVLRDHSEDDEESLIDAQLHDVIEDGGVSYNQVKERFGFGHAEVSYLCSDNKGRNRDSRKNQAFYDEIKLSKFRLRVTKVKVADRLANARRSIKNGHSMGKKYIKEHPHFREQLYVPGHIVSMWAELDKLMEYGA